jgi:hypothetical protein
MIAVLLAIVVLIVVYLVLLAFNVPYAFGIALVCAIGAFIFNLPARWRGRSGV